MCCMPSQPSAREATSISYSARCIDVILSASKSSSTRSNANEFVGNCSTRNSTRLKRKPTIQSRINPCRDDVVMTIGRQFLLLGGSLIVSLACNAPAVDRQPELGESSEISDQSLLEALDDRSPGIRSTAVALADRLDRKAAWEVVKRGVVDEHPAVRASAAATLGRMDQDAALPALVELSSDPVPLVRLRAVQALGMSSSQQAHGALTQALSDRNLDVRRAAAHSLIERARPEAIPSLIAALQDDDLDTRLGVLQALARLAPREARPALERLAQSPNPFERALAGQALAKLAE